MNDHLSLHFEEINSVAGSPPPVGTGNSATKVISPKCEDKWSFILELYNEPPAATAAAAAAAVWTFTGAGASGSGIGSTSTSTSTSSGGSGYDSVDSGIGSSGSDNVDSLTMDLGLGFSAQSSIHTPPTKDWLATDALFGMDFWGTSEGLN
ncbi:unnamed protein product [Ectocarpus sp. CCAP 1310/34]|nr:unnamed protein product [Ectocarpus sp. CCAP 1310/34]